MKAVMLSEHLRASYPATKSSMSLRRLVKGVGVNDADYITTVYGNDWRIECPAKVSWMSMMNRCYGRSYLDKFGSYRGVSVCEEWLSFMSFRDWWVQNYVDGWHLDKDLLSPDRVYSPKTCVYVPQWLNNFLTDHRSARGDCPVGVTKQKNRFKAVCSNPLTKKSEYIGLFANATDAHSAWVDKKIEHANSLRQVMDSIDCRIYPRVIDHIKTRLAAE